MIRHLTWLYVGNKPFNRSLCHDCVTGLSLRGGHLADHTCPGQAVGSISVDGRAWPSLDRSLGRLRVASLLALRGCDRGHLGARQHLRPPVMTIFDPNQLLFVWHIPNDLCLPIIGAADSGSLG